MERANRTNSAALAFLERLKEELDRLVPRDFVIRYESERLCRLPAYLDALTVRAQNGILHLEKDKEKEAKVKVFSDALGRLREGLTPFTSEEKLRAVEGFRWMVEEFRLSVFAQRIKTAFPVSPKRLEERLREIERMA